MEYPTLYTIIAYYNKYFHIFVFINYITMDLTKYTIEELIALKHNIMDIIHNYEDGYTYICKVRSYGRNWVDKSIKNKHSLQDLCYEYDGDNGIVDAYSTNPDLGDIHNYGDLKYIQSVEDYEKWYDYELLKDSIPSIEKELDEWDNRDNVPFNKRPYFSPVYTREDLARYKKKLAEYDVSFVAPQPYVHQQEE